MAILAFQKPDKVVMLEANDKFGKFEFRPLEPGFGVTIGNALRRILLSSLEGYAINTIRIQGVEHEFSSVPGVKEDVTNIILNLKQVRFKQVVEEFENEKVSITVENSTEFKAGDIGKYLTGFEVLNPDLVICHLDSKASMQIDLTINKTFVVLILPFRHPVWHLPVIHFSSVCLVLQTNGFFSDALGDVRDEFFRLFENLVVFLRVRHIKERHVGVG